MLSRVAAFVAERARNVLVREASGRLTAGADGALARRRPFRAGDRVKLGPAGREVRVSRLALGTGSDGWSGSSNQTRKLGVDGLSELFVRALREHDINFWDSADQYGSHPHLKAALRHVRREEVVILTKTVATTADAMRRDLDRFRQELGTDTIDILLLHCMTDADWPRRMRGVMDVISEAQEAGVVGIKGVSCHSFSALQAAAREPWVEVDLVRINPAGQSMDAGPDKVVPVVAEMKRRGKSIIGMKVLGNGKLADRREACLRFVLGLESVDCFTIGFESWHQLDEIVGVIGRV